MIARPCWMFGIFFFIWETGVARQYRVYMDKLHILNFFVLTLVVKQAALAVSGVANCNHMADHFGNCEYKKITVLHFLGSII